MIMHHVEREELVTNQPCPECGDLLPEGVLAAYRLLYGDFKLSTLRLAEWLEDAMRRGDEEIEARAFEDWLGVGSLDYLTLAVRHRMDEATRAR